MATLSVSSRPTIAGSARSANRRQRLVSAARRPLRLAVRASTSDTGHAPVQLSRRALGAAAAAVVTAGSAMLLPTPPAAKAKLVDYLLDQDDKVQEVSMVLGSPSGDYVFTPSTLTFTQGKIYKLKLSNPSSSTHYFTALEFADKVFSILVLAGDPAVEVKGAIHEVALKAGASATWVFMPIKPGKYPLKCTVKGHDAMKGELIIKRA